MGSPRLRMTGRNCAAVMRAAAVPALAGAVLLIAGSAPGAQQGGPVRGRVEIGIPVAAKRPTSAAYPGRSVQTAASRQSANYGTSWFTSRTHRHVRGCRPSMSRSASARRTSCPAWLPSPSGRQWIFRTTIRFITTCSPSRRRRTSISAGIRKASRKGSPSTSPDWCACSVTSIRT